MAPSIQLLKGADLLENSRNNWSIVSSSLSVRWEDYKISHICCVFLNPEKPIASHLQLSVRSHLHISQANPKTNIPSPVLMTNPSLVFSWQSLLSAGDDGVWEMDRKQNPVPDLILGPFPRPSHICRFGMASMDQRKWLAGFWPVTLWAELMSISPLSPPPSHFTILSGSGKGIQLSLLINQLCLHCSNVIDS